MIRQLIRAKRRQILVDINTQEDFFVAGGNACIRNHRRVLIHIRRVMAWARQKKIPIISISEVYDHNNKPVTSYGCEESAKKRCYQNKGWYYIREFNEYGD